MKKNNHLILAKEWFEAADRDLSDAILLGKEGGHPETICFHCHQAVEKYLKGFLVLNDQDIKDEFKIHDLSRLLGYCAKFKPDLGELKDGCETLNKYYLQSRYPSYALQDYSDKAVKQALEFAGEVKEKILASL